MHHARKRIGHRVKYGLDHFLDHFLDYFLDHFLDHFIGGKHTISIQGGVGCSLLEGVGGRVFLLWEG